MSPPRWTHRYTTSAPSCPPQLLQIADDVMGVNAVGPPEQVAAQMQEFGEEHDLDELIITTYVYDPGLRRRSFQLLATEWGMTD